MLWLRYSPIQTSPRASPAWASHAAHSPHPPGLHEVSCQAPHAPHSACAPHGMQIGPVIHRLDHTAPQAESDLQTVHLTPAVGHCMTRTPSSRRAAQTDLAAADETGHGSKSAGEGGVCLAVISLVCFMHVGLWGFSREHRMVG